MDRVGIYARARKVLDEDAEKQLSELRAYCTNRGWRVVGEDVDFSVGNHPSLDRLMVDAHRRFIDRVLVSRIDRFGDSLKFMLAAIEDFDALGVSFLSLKEGFDLGTAQGRLLLHIVSMVSEFLGNYAE